MPHPFRSGKQSNLHPKWLHQFFFKRITHDHLNAHVCYIMHTHLTVCSNVFTTYFLSFMICVLGRLHMASGLYQSASNRSNSTPMSFFFAWHCAISSEVIQRSPPSTQDIEFCKVSREGFIISSDQLKEYQSTLAVSFCLGQIRFICLIYCGHQHGRSASTTIHLLKVYHHQCTQEINLALMLLLALSKIYSKTSVDKGHILIASPTTSFVQCIITRTPLTLASYFAHSQTHNFVNSCRHMASSFGRRGSKRPRKQTSPIPYIIIIFISLKAQL